LPSYARCQVHRNQSQKENQKIVHPNFNLGLTRQRSIYGRLNYTISILQLSILYFFNFGIFALFKALHHLRTAEQNADRIRGRETVTEHPDGTYDTIYSRIAFVFEELRTSAFLIFFFTLIRPLAERKIIVHLCVGGFSLVMVTLNSVFSLDSMSKYHYHVSVVIQCSFAVRYCLVTIFMSLKVFNCGDYKLVPSNVNQTSVTYFQNSKLVSIGFLIVTSLVTSSSILSVLTLYNLPLTATLPIMMNLGTLILFSLIIFIHHLDLEFDSDHNKNVTESIEQLTQNPFAQTNMDVIP
jgi:hypothetical protein